MSHEEFKEWTSINKMINIIEIEGPSTSLGLGDDYPYKITIGNLSFIVIAPPIRLVKVIHKKGWRDKKINTNKWKLIVVPDLGSKWEGYCGVKDL